MISLSLNGKENLITAGEKVTGKKTAGARVVEKRINDPNATITIAGKKSAVKMLILQLKASPQKNMPSSQPTSHSWQLRNQGACWTQEQVPTSTLSGRTSRTFEQLFCTPLEQQMAGHSMLLDKRR
jgi:hypothetical protein